MLELNNLSVSAAHLKQSSLVVTSNRHLAKNQETYPLFFNSVIYLQYTWD